MNKGLKKSIACFTIGAIILTGSPGTYSFDSVAGIGMESNVAYASNVFGYVRIFIDKEEVRSDVSPVIEKGRTLVPARVISENLGFEVEWDQPSRTATLIKDGVEYDIKIGSNKITTSDGRAMKLDVPAKVTNGRTMLPLRAIVEISGASVKWDSPSRSVLVNSTGGEVEKPDGLVAVPKNGTLITEASYNGKTIKINNKSWKVKNGDVWFKDTGSDRGWIDLEKLFPSFVIGSYRVDGDVMVSSSKGKKIKTVVANGEHNISDTIRKSGGSSKVVGNKMVIDLHPDQAYADKNTELTEQGQKDLEDWHNSISHVPQEEYNDREYRMVSAIKYPADMGYKFVGIRPYNNSSLKDIKYAVKYIGDANNAPQIVKNSGPLKAGDKFVITSDNNSPSMGWKKGHYVFQIPKNAKAIHKSGDMRYGWTDSRYDTYAMKYLNAVRTNHSDYEYDQSKRLPNLKLTAPVANQMQWHKDQVIKTYGMKPQTFGLHGSKLLSHYEKGDARMEVLAHSHKNLSSWYKDEKGNFKKSSGIATLLGSGIHAGIMMDGRYDDMSVLNIYRPDLTEITVMTFGR